MKPTEVDYSSNVRIYFDLTNGEVLAGKRDVQAYANAGHSLEAVHELGTLLHEEQHRLPPGSDTYEPLNTHNWSTERFKSYGRWLYRLSQQTAPEDVNVLDRNVITQAQRLGVGPGLTAIKGTFNTLSHFYQSINATSTRRKGNFDDWGLDDFVNYIQRIGKEEGRKPTYEDITQRARANTRMPDRNIMYDRFRPIGGVLKLLELAGYVVVNSWDNDDYVAWGVKFMEMNGGSLPTQDAIQFLSSRGFGPSKRPINERFGNLSEFQKKVINAFWEAQAEKENELQEKISDIRSRTRTGWLPNELFYTQPTSMKEDEEPENRQYSETDTCHGMPLNADDIVSNPEMMLRYAKYILLDDIAPRLALDKKISLCIGSELDRRFITLVRKTCPDIAAGQIESTALLLGVFEEIWPISDMSEHLILDADYEAFLASKRVKRKQRQLGQNAAKSL